MRRQERLSCSGSSFVLMGFPQEGLLRGCATSPQSRAVSFSSASFLEAPWKMLSLPGKESAFRGKLPWARDAQLCGPCLLLCSDLHQEHLEQPEASCVLAVVDVQLALG